jgi:hypothetical protein
MKKTLIILSSDPRTSPRVAEAFRLAAGLSVWGQLEVSMLLTGAARASRHDETESWCDGRLIEQYRGAVSLLEDEETLSAKKLQSLRAEYDQVIQL